MWPCLSSILAARGTRPWARATEHAAYAAHALPGLVVALAMVFIGIRVVPSLYLETPLLVATYVVFFLPLAVGSVRASVVALDPAIGGNREFVGAGSGAGAYERITLPLAAPRGGCGAALVVLTCMKELPATLLLQSDGNGHVGYRTVDPPRLSPAYGEAAPYTAALFMMLAAIPTVLLTRNCGVRGPRDDDAVSELRVQGCGSPLVRSRSWLALISTSLRARSPRFSVPPDVARPPCCA